MFPVEPGPGSNVMTHALPAHAAKQAVHHNTRGRDRAYWPRM